MERAWEINALSMSAWMGPASLALCPSSGKTGKASREPANSNRRSEGERAGDAGWHAAWLGVLELEDAVERDRTWPIHPVEGNQKMSTRPFVSPPTSTGGTIPVPAWPGTAVRIAMGLVIAGLVSLVTVAAQIRLAEETVSAPVGTTDRPASIGEWPVIDPAPSAPFSQDANDRWHRNALARGKSP
jgi:hypothetical protein